MADGLNCEVNSDSSKVTYLKDYQPPAFLIDTTDLTFDLQIGKAVVHSRLAMRKNPAAVSDVLELDGEDLLLQSIEVDGEPLNAESYQLHDGGLSLGSMPEVFVLEIVTEIDDDGKTVNVDYKEDMTVTRFDMAFDQNAT